MGCGDKLPDGGLACATLPHSVPAMHYHAELAWYLGLALALVGAAGAIYHFLHDTKR